MATQDDAAEMLNLLESSDLNVAHQIQNIILENLSNYKEAWLVNSLVDSFTKTNSQRCLSILTLVREPHDKQLLERLSDHVRGTSKLEALTILGHLIRSQTPWLHHIVHHSLLTNTLKCLKTETDVPILMSGVLAITSLLPIVPLMIVRHLPDIFEVFARLAAFNLSKPGSVPDMYVLHLQVGTYSLFHRLYAMYPCRFFTFLRGFYSTRDHRHTFEETIKPMLQKVRMHPLLVTETRETEIARERWRQMEVHDIIIECSKLSLDPTEGNSEERCPLGNIQHIATHSLPSYTAMDSTASVSSMLSDLGAPPINSLLGNIDPIALWSQGSGQAGTVITPPAAAIVTDSIRNTSARTTPYSTVPESPLPVLDSSQSTFHKRLSSSGLTLTGVVPTPAGTPTYGGEGSVPPSPLKPNFTNEPPLSAQRMQAIRKLTFQYSEDKVAALEESDSHPVAKMPAMSKTEDQCKETQWVDEEKWKANVCVESIVSSSNEGADKHLVLDILATSARISNKDREVDTQAGTQIGREDGRERSESFPSVLQLPKVIDKLVSKPTEEESDDDDEVSELTGLSNGDVEALRLTDGDTSSDGSCTPSHLPPNLKLTAESVASFMKQANRLRFTSININQSSLTLEKTQEISTERSKSCPDLDNKFEELINFSSNVQKVTSREKKFTNKVLHKKFGYMMRDRSGSDKWSKSGCVPGARLLYSTPEPTSSHPESTGTSTSPVLNSSKCTMASQTSFVLGGDDEAETVAAVRQACCPYEQLFPLSLPFSPFIQCYRCATNPDTQATAVTNNCTVIGGAITPLFSSYPPADLLDRRLQDAHTSHQKTETVQVLKSQLHMLHQQLMFERHKRDVHACRNRRMFGRIAKTTALEEQTAALKQQLSLQEQEIQNLKVALRLQQQQSTEMKVSRETAEQERDRLIKKFRQDQESLQTLLSDSEVALAHAHLEKEQLFQELQKLRALMFTRDREIERLSLRVKKNQQLQEQVTRLNQELLLMGELQQKYQERLLSSSGHQGHYQHKFLLESYKKELTVLKTQLAEKTIQLEEACSHCMELEENLRFKDTAIMEQKRILENNKDMHRTQLAAVEGKYETQRSVQMALQPHILSLQSQLALLESTTRTSAQLRGSPKHQKKSAQAHIETSGEEGACASTECTGEENTNTATLKCQTVCPESEESTLAGGVALPTVSAQHKKDVLSSDGEVSVEDAVEAVTMDLSELSS